MDVLLAELFREPVDPPVRPDGPTARILRDLWMGGMPLPRAAIAAGLTSKANRPFAASAFCLSSRATGPPS